MPDSAQHTKLRINLNLLHPKELQMKLSERFIKWLITYGRFIVILVEIVVVGAFLMRFKYDADLDFLKKEINKDLPYIEGLAPKEAEIDQAQSRLALFDKTYSSADRWPETVVSIAAVTPSSIQFLGLSLEDKDEKTVSFKINATSVSNVDLGIFLNNLRTQKNFREINLANISFEGDRIVFTITGTSTKNES